MKGTAGQPSIDKLVSRVLSSDRITGAVLCVETGDRSFTAVSSGGNLQANDYYFVASVTKLYVTAILLNLRREKRLHLDDPIGKFLPEADIKGIHVYKGTDYSHTITVRQLMSNTSGIPDYFSFSAFRELQRGKDQPWEMGKVLETAKQLKPRFTPGQRGKAQYSDTNYRLLGSLIENAASESLRETLNRYIVHPLQLEFTYLYEDADDVRPAPLTYRAKQLHLPKYMSSIGAEGAVVSTAQETMKFLRAFMGGGLFRKRSQTISSETRKSGCF